MIKRSEELMSRIIEFAEDYYLQNNASPPVRYECQLESEPCARLILSHLCSFESEPPKHRSLNDPTCRSPHSYQGHMI